MGLHNRKSSVCDPIISCPPNPSYYVPSDDDEGIQSPTKHIKTSTYLIISFSIVATAFFVLCCYAIYAKFFSGRRRTRPPSQQPQTQDHFLDEEHDPAVDHHIWHIRTTGLHQSAIGAITVCKYKKGEGLVEGTECSVCLGEFQEDENLRLLPKCNHAFHLPCIDTWLTSHTNCPMCRAPILTDPTRVPSMDPNAFASTSFVQIDLSESTLNAEAEEGEGQMEAENSGSQVVTVQPRRSVSLDSSSADKITLALATVMPGESRGTNSKRVARGGCGSSSAGSIKRSRSFNAKHLLSWYARSQRKPNANAPLRSF